MSLDFVPAMSNEELAQAIEATRHMLGDTGTSWSFYKPLDEHLKRLLEAQANRAVIFNIVDK